MKGLVKEQLSAGIAKWLPRGHIITNDAQQNENTLVIGWMNGYGTTSTIDLSFDRGLIDELQKAIETHGLLKSYLEKIKAEILRLVDLHDDDKNRSWNLTGDILLNDSTPMPRGESL